MALTGIHALKSTLTPILFGGAITSGNLKGAGLGALSAVGFFEVGQFVDGLEAVNPDTGTSAVTNSEGAAIRVGLHTMVGGLASAAGGGQFGSGFLAAGIGEIASQLPSVGNVGNLAIAAAAGGLGSELGGGKFENGAITGAFGYIFNDLEECARGGPCTPEEARLNKLGVVQDQTFNLTTLFVGAFKGIGLAYDFLFGADASLDFASQVGVLRDAAVGKGNFGLGTATAEQSDVLGKAWVGEGYTTANDGETLVSADGLRQYRPPSYKPKLGSWQSNFEQRFQPSGQWQSNGHLNISGQ